MSASARGAEHPRSPCGHMRQPGTHYLLMPCATPGCHEGDNRWAIWLFDRADRVVQYERWACLMKPHGTAKYVTTYLWRRM